MAATKLLTQLLTLAGLIGGTIEYLPIVRRHVIARRLASVSGSARTRLASTV